MVAGRPVASTMEGNSKQNLESYLRTHGIEYIRHEHPAVFTCEEAEKHCSHIPGISSKNLLLQDEKKHHFFLVIVPDYKRADLKSLAIKLGVKKLSFVSADTMEKLLNVTPGSVSPFGLVNDADQKVRLIIDRGVREAEIVTFHPNDNTATLQLSQEMFQKYLKILRRDSLIIEV